MTHFFKFIITAVSLATFAGCVEDPSGASVPGNAVETAARQACLNATIRETGNTYASVERSSFSEAGTEVIVVIGAQKAAWRCVAYRDGSTTQPMSLTNEGTL